MSLLSFFKICRSNGKRHQLWSLPCITSALATVLCMNMFAAAQSTDLYISGFASQGFLITSGNRFLVDKSLEGSFELNETGIAIQANPNDRLRVGIQMLARDVGEEGNNVVMLDWAMGDYHWRDYLGIRAGKIKLPLGFYNQGRDIDMLRTSILLPQSVYYERQRDFVLAHEGLSVYGNVPLHAKGYLDYEVYCGTLNVPDVTHGFWGSIFQAGGAGSAVDLAPQFAAKYGANPANTSVVFLGSEEESVQFPVVYGGALTWFPPIQGLRVGTTWLIGEFDMSAKWNYAVSLVDSAGDRREFTTQADFNNEFHLDQIDAFSAEYAVDRLTIAAEYNSSVLDQGFGFTSREEGYYGSVSYRVCDRVTVGSYYSLYYTRADDHKGKYTEEIGAPDYIAWEKDLVFSTRVDLSPNWLVKAEYHYLDGVALHDEVQIREDLANNHLKRYWNALMLKTTVHF